MSNGDDIPGKDETVRLPGGETVLVRHYGDTAGAPVLMLHGTPGSRYKFSSTDAAGKRLGLHVIAPDRWAYGGTEAPRTQSLALFARWMCDAMSAMGHARFAVSGISGGGPYATAIAAHCPDRITALALISPVGLVSEARAAGEVDLFHRFCFGPLAARPRAIRSVFAVYGAAVRRMPNLAARLTVTRAPAPDQAIMNDPAVRSRLLNTFAEGLKTSAAGPAIDLALFRELALIDLAKVTAQARVWIGTRDTNVPVTAATRLAQRLPNAELTVLAGEGHLWAAMHYDEVLAWVAAAIASEGKATL